MKGEIQMKRIKFIKRVVQAIKLILMIIAVLATFGLIFYEILVKMGVYIPG